jgi:hypothetical protein
MCVVARYSVLFQTYFQTLSTFERGHEFAHPAPDPALVFLLSQN